MLTTMRNPRRNINKSKKRSAKLSELGLGLGIYTAHGPLTCQDYPGSLGYEKQDVALYNTWNVTYVKNDWCWRLPNVTQEMHLNAFNAMRDALAALERPVVHSIHWNSDAVPGPNCAPGVDCPMPDTANMWRIGGDIGPVFTKGVLRLLDADAKHAAAAGPGSWNDADMYVRTRRLAVRARVTPHTLNLDLSRLQQFYRQMLNTTDKPHLFFL